MTEFGDFDARMAAMRKTAEDELCKKASNVSQYPVTAEMRSWDPAADAAAQQALVHDLETVLILGNAPALVFPGGPMGAARGIRPVARPMRPTAVRPRFSKPAAVHGETACRTCASKPSTAAQLEAHGYRKVAVDSKDFDTYINPETKEVVKVPKNRGDGSAEYAKKYADEIEKLRADPELRDVIPETTYDDAAGVVRQRQVEGLDFGDLERLGGDVEDNAMANADRIVARAKESAPGLGVDENYFNFKYDDKGNVTGWFDPVSDRTR